MLPGFENLSAPELDQLLEAPVLIAALIGGADGRFDQEERTWSNHLVEVFTYDKPKQVKAFYQLVADQFLEKVDRQFAALPADVAARTAQISAQLAALNPLLARLDTHLGALLYRSFIGLAQETAKASGGFLRIGAIGDAESRLVGLSMLTPILPPQAEP